MRLAVIVPGHRDSVTVVSVEPPLIPRAEERTARESIGPELSVIDRHVVELFALVSEATAGATHALVTGDREAARGLVKRDEIIDSLYREVEFLVETELVETDPDRDRRRYLVAMLRMLPELERSGDLAEHIAQRAVRPIAVEMSPRSRGLVERMGEVAAQMWVSAADAFGDRAPEVAVRMEELDDEMDDLHTTFIAEIVGSGVATQIAIELALIGRFYERLGDHAVNLTRNVPGGTQRFHRIRE
jgi:phosphate transport system protein